MPPSLTQILDDEKIRFLQNCTACGLCDASCPIVSRTSLKDFKPKDIQARVKAFLENPEASGEETLETAQARGLSCMECFGCVKNVCPQGLDPFQINEIVKAEIRRLGLWPAPDSDPAAQDSEHRIAAARQLSARDHEKIFTPTPTGPAQNVFFPGCNVYLAPELLTTALDVLTRVDPDLAFLPGLDHCCGDKHFWNGCPQEAERESRRLMDALAEYSPENVIFWCPTCLCRFEISLAPVIKPPFRRLSAAQFLTAHLDRLNFKNKIEKTITLHEACKTSFTGLDLEGPRKILQNIAGLTLKEMPRHKEKTSCCGSGAVAFYPQSFDSVLHDRLAEAKATGAQTLVDVCHFCHQSFMPHQKKYGLEIKNYISLIAQAL